MYLSRHPCTWVGPPLFAGEGCEGQAVYVDLHQRCVITSAALTSAESLKHVTEENTAILSWARASCSMGQVYFVRTNSAWLCRQAHVHVAAGSSSPFSPSLCVLPALLQAGGIRSPTKLGIGWCFQGTEIKDAYSKLLTDIMSARSLGLVVGLYL